MMAWIKHAGRLLLRFLTRRLMLILRVVTGVFMILLGLWFTFAPVTQQFFVRGEELSDSPFLWLIVPVGILQIVIGYSFLRPFWHRKDPES